MNFIKYINKLNKINYNKLINNFEIKLKYILLKYKTFHS